jgi:hypothetical protein
MAGGAFVGPSTGGNYEGRVTTFVITTCLVAAMGGLIFGYDIGISGNKWKTFYLIGVTKIAVYNMSLRC